MSADTKQWLPQLNNSVPEEVTSDKLSMYTIALEGWRRGLTLKFFNIKYGRRLEINYSLASKDREYKFAVSKGEKVTKEAMKISKSKISTKKYLTKNNVPVPIGEKFGADREDQDIINYAVSLGFPVVLKPTDGNLGKGVIPNILNIKDLKDALKHVRVKLGYREVIIEQHITGEEYRIYVIDGKVIGAINRIPANIIGDGKSSIQQLITKKNLERKKNPNLKNRPIKIDKEVKKYVKQAGYTFESIPKKDEQIFLRKNSNVSSGGDPIDVTDELTPEIKEIAVGASKAIPGLVQCGVDVIVNKANNTGAVIEVNTRPGIGSHLYPVKGKARDIPSAIIDYYFPETKTSTNNFYFDYKDITEILRSKKAMEVKVTQVPLQNFIIKAFQVFGRVQGVGYRKWIQRKALSLKLDGFVKNQSDGSVLIVIAGNEENIKAFKNIVNKQAPRRGEVKEVIEQNWDKPIKVGFEIEETVAKNNRGVIVEKKQNKEQTSKKFTLGATGDILLHTRLYKTAKEGNGYNFEPKLTEVKHLFEQEHVNIVNQESIIAGKEIGLSSFPQFNSPVEIGYLLKDLGVDIVNIANNHVLDKGEEGLLKSIENLEKIGLPYVGAYKSSTDQEELRILNKNGLKICFLSYTRTTGIGKVSGDKEYLINQYHPMRLKKIKDQIKMIRNKNIADVIIVSLHFGKEYHLQPTSEQKEVSRDLSDAGADIIIGHHPHVLQPPEWILNSRGKKSFVAYSLGNFYTGQKGLYRQIGAFLTIDIAKESSDSTMLKIDNPKMKLTFVDSTDKKDFKMSLFKDIVENREYIKTDMGVFKSIEVYDEIRNRMKQWIPDLDIT